MTDKRMALVPRETTNEEIEAAHKTMYVEPYTGETAVALGAGIDAARASAPHGGKVSRERLLKAVYANCTATSAFGCGCVCIGLSPCEWHIKQTRAVIAALGLEIEE